jgi:hypothetical protein
LGVLLAVSGVIFGAAVKAYRTAEATAQISRKLAAITDQLNADFMGIRKNMPAAVSFDVDDPCLPVRLDRIIFFADGDFQSVLQYDGQTVAGNVASIFYGQSDSPDPNLPEPEDRRRKILARKQTIFTADPCLPDPFDPCSIPTYEYEKRSLAEWLANRPTRKEWIRRPDVDINVEECIPMFMTDGVDDFTIQFDNGINADGSLNWWPTDAEVAAGMPYAQPYPRAVKFTFTLYDSQGIFREGKTFTHIVYLGD